MVFTRMVVALEDNFGIQFEHTSIEQNVTRLTNQTWKLIPMREHDEDWEKQLDTVNIEIAGLGVIFAQCPQFLSLRAKLEGLKEVDTTFELYRRTVFECISLLQEVKKNVRESETENS